MAKKTSNKRPGKSKINLEARTPINQPVSIAVQTHRIFDAASKTQDKAGKVAQTADGFENFSSRLGLNQDNALSAGLYEFNLMTRNRIQLEAAYRGSWVVGAVIDSKADDMTRAGIQITTNEAAEDIKELQAAFSRLKVHQSIADGVRWGNLYGGALGIIQIAGQKLDTPLRLDTVGKDQFQGIVIYDRWQLNPDLQNVIDSGPDMGLPKYYYIVTTNTPTGNAQGEKRMVSAQGQIKVHFSRVIRFTGVPLPYWQATTEMMWGESVLERLWDRLISFDTATMSSANLINRAQLRTIGVDGLREILATGGKAQQGLEAMFDMMRILQVNEGLTLMDKEDTFQSTAYSFAGLSDMMLQFGQQLAGASGIPLVRLFGQSPAGLSATGESDLRMYYDNINAQQEAKLRNAYELLLKVMYRSLTGKDVPKDLEFTFTSLWQMSALDKANIGKTVAETIAGAYDAGLVDRPTAMKELRQDAADTGLFTHITDEDIKDAEMEAPPEPKIELEEQPAKEPDVAVETQKKDEPGKATDAEYIRPFDKIKRWLRGE